MGQAPQECFITGLQRMWSVKSVAVAGAPPD